MMIRVLDWLKYYRTTFRTIQVGVSKVGINNLKVCAGIIKNK